MRRAPRSPLRSPAHLPSGLFLALLTVVACSGAENSAEAPTAIRPTEPWPVTVLKARVAAGRNPGIVLGIVDDSGPRVYAVGTSGRTGLALDGRTLFEIGSITKVFTATLLVDAVGRGEVRLDQPVRELLPAGVRVPASGGREITLVDLATHTAGLPRNPTNMVPADPFNPFADYTVAQLYEFLATYPLPRAPGAAYAYSNVGMGLLGHALALRAGRVYEDLLRERLLDSLAMNDTRITLAGELAGRFAQGHSGGAPTSSWELPTLAGAGALRSDAQDLLRFLAANLAAGPAGLPATFAVTRQPRVTAWANMAVGLAWHIDTRQGHPIVWHDGGTGGFCAFAGYDTAARRGVVVLTNSSELVDDIGFYFLDARYGLTGPAPPARVSSTAGFERGGRPGPVRITVAPGPDRVAPGRIGVTGATPASAGVRLFVPASQALGHVREGPSGQVTTPVRRRAGSPGDRVGRRRD